jgi:hypothetical protein
MCKKPFQRVARGHNPASKHFFCSRPCMAQHQIEKIVENCKNCNKPVSRVPSQRKNSVNVFCNSSCSATYNNKHKTHGTRRSKLEQFVEANLQRKYPGLVFISNGLLDGFEFDLYFPKLQLCIEFNGIFHYQPIYGAKKFEQITNRDNEKVLYCKLKNLQLVVIPCLEQRPTTLEIQLGHWNTVCSFLPAIC